MKKTIMMLAFCVAVYTNTSAQHHSKLTAQFDKVLKENLALDETGVTVLVSRGGNIIYTKTLGKADVELNLPMQINNVFRIASITKQFTAVAILQQIEAGKLNLRDEITKYLPDYPVQGNKITIENLLTHTSGIWDYSSMPDSLQRGRVDIHPKEMIDYFKNKPMRFAPGSRYEYSNSNYFLLGYILEKLTGKSYQQYLEDHFFKPLGMSNSSFDNPSTIIKNRAAGYTKVEGKIHNAAAISMTRVYAAGGMLSTVEDLFKWQQAVQSYKLIKKETLDKAYTKYKLSNGKEINYGYGWRQGFIQESPSLWHGGLINGFMTMAMYLPKEDVYVTILSNCDCFFTEITTAKLAAVAIGKPFDYHELTLANDILQTYGGIYENAEGDQLLISVNESKLYLQRGKGPKVPIKAYGKDNFYINEALITMEFASGTKGNIEKLKIKTRTGNEIWKKSDKPLPTLAELKIDEKILEMYIGKYEVTPEFGFTITKEKNSLFLKATGQEKLEMFAEANNKFYLKVNDAKFEFVNESGKITKVKMKQEGRSADAKKIN